MTFKDQFIYHKFMSDNLTPVEKRIAIARTWSKRIDKLSSRKSKPMSEAEFCRVHKFNQAHFNRNKNLLKVPSQRTVDAVEKALSAEGV